MKTLLTITTFFVTMLFVCSCRKKDPLFDGVTCSGNCYILTGKLIDSAANTGIARGEIKFYLDETTGPFSSQKRFLGRATTDENGNYSFKFDGNRLKNAKGYYYAEAFSGNMFGENQSFPNRVATFYLDTSIYNLPFIQNFALFHPATVKVRVIASTVTNFQFLTVSYNYGKVGGGIVFNGNRSIDTTITWKTAGDLKTFVHASATGNGVNIEKRDSLIIPTNLMRQIEIRL
jgi:hypothetical protein